MAALLARRGWPQASGCTAGIAATVTMRKAVVGALLAIASLAVLSLASGAAYLEATLPGGLPLGNALVALGLCAVAGTAVALSVRGTKLRVASLAALFAAASWLPASVALAGNLALNFGGGRGLAWLILSLAVVTSAFGTLLWASVCAVLAKHRGSGAA